MAIKALIEKLEDVDEGLRTHYKVRPDGKFEIEGDFASIGLENILPLSKANKRLKAERQELRDEVDPLRRFASLVDIEGFDPVEVETLMAARAAGGGDTEAIEALERKHQKTVQQLQTDLEAAVQVGVDATEKQNSFIIESTLKSAAIEAGVVPELIDDVVALNRNKVVFEGEKLYMKDTDGDSTGHTPVEFLSGQHKQDKPHYYEPEGTGGTGQKSNGKGDQTGAAASYKDAKSNDEKLAAIQAKREAAGREV